MSPAETPRQHLALQTAEDAFQKQDGKYYYKYVSFWGPDDAVLDGEFTIEQLEFIVVAMKEALNEPRQD